MRGILSNNTESLTLNPLKFYYSLDIRDINRYPNIKKRNERVTFERTKSSPKIPKSKETDKSQTPKSKKRERARIAINHRETYHQASPTGSGRQYTPPLSLLLLPLPLPHAILPFHRGSPITGSFTRESSRGPASCYPSVPL